MTDAAGAATFRIAADAYDRFVGRYSPELAQRLCDFAGVREGMRALDVGCGPGALTAALAGRLGAERVCAADPSEPFVRAVRERVPAARIEFAAAESLPFDDAAFDVSLAQLVVNFMSDATAGVGEMRRVTRQGGTVAAAVWDYGGEMTLLRRFWDAAAAVDPAAGADDEGRRMRHCDPDSLGHLWRASGLDDVRVDGVVVSADYRGFDDLWEPLESGVGPAGAHVVSLEPARRAAVRSELQRRLDVADEPFTLTARAWCVAGSVP